MDSVLENLATILRGEYKLPKGAQDDIKFLKEELEVMHSVLLRMSDVEEPEEQALLGANAVRKMSCNIDNNINKLMFLVKHESSSEAHGFQKLINKEITKEIKDIKNQLKVVGDRFPMCKKIEESSFSKPTNEKVDPRLRAIYQEAAGLVGIDAPKDDLLKLIYAKENESLKIICIVGVGGVGKTTLATQVYNVVKANFECKIFLSIPQRPDIKKIFGYILSQISNQNRSYTGLENERQLINMIRDSLRDKRYMIILDDIWDITTWETLKWALVENSCGSVIMTTTRRKDVAISCRSSPGYAYQMTRLTDANSRRLFFERIFGSEEVCPYSLRACSEQILANCGGLPLAIIAVSSLLASSQTKDVWDWVQSSFSLLEGNNIADMNQILSLSYFDLPDYLRSCLLYLTLFPEDYKIGRQRLVHRWISEGFIQGRQGRADLVEFGEACFHELVNRSLIQPVDIGYDGKARFCRVHIIILDFLIYRSSIENFSTNLSNHSKPRNRVRRLSLMGNDDEGNVEQLDLSHARSLGAFRDVQQLPALLRLKSLLVLDLQGCHGLGNNHIQDIGKLYLLRYLNISDTAITELPENVTGLKDLAFLFVPSWTKFPDGVGNMINLQELEFIDTFKLKHTEELGKLTNLKKLSIIWNIHGTEENKLVCYKEKLVSSICKLDAGNLRNLCIDFHLGGKDGLEGDPFFPALDCIREVNIQSGEICRITNWLPSLANLAKLYICFGKIDQQDLEMIGSMPNLLELDVQIPGNNKPLIITRDGFQQLQSFRLRGDCKRLLIFKAGAMPKLKQLDLSLRLEKFEYAASLHCAVGDLDFGIDHLSCLACVRVAIFSYGVTAADVEDAEGAFKDMVEAHPNRPIPTLEIRRTGAVSSVTYEG